MMDAVEVIANWMAEDALFAKNPEMWMTEARAVIAALERENYKIIKITKVKAKPFDFSDLVKEHEEDRAAMIAELERAGYDITRKGE